MRNLFAPCPVASRGATHHAEWGPRQRRFRSQRRRGQPHEQVRALHARRRRGFRHQTDRGDGCLSRVLDDREALARSEVVAIAGFGTFTTRVRSARRAAIRRPVRASLSPHRGHRRSRRGRSSATPSTLGNDPHLRDRIGELRCTPPSLCPIRRLSGEPWRRECAPHRSGRTGTPPRLPASLRSPRLNPIPCATARVRFHHTGRRHPRRIGTWGQGRTKRRKSATAGGLED